MTVLRSPLRSVLRSPLYSPLVGKWGGAFSPSDLFQTGDILLWYDPSDLSTMFTNTTGTTQVSADGDSVALMLDKGQWGGKTLSQVLAAQADLAAGIFSGTSGWTFNTADVTVSGGALTFNTPPSTAVSATYNPIVTSLKRYAVEITLTGTGQASVRLGSAGDQYLNMVAPGSYTFLGQPGGGTPTSLVVSSVVSAVNNFVGTAVVSVKEIPGYHRIQATGTSMPKYKTDGTLHWLLYDGTDDGHATGTITWGTDEVAICAGVTKSSDAATGAFAELSANYGANAGTFVFLAPNTTLSGYRFGTSGSISQINASTTGFTAPITKVVTAYSDISSDTAILRANAVQAASSTSDQGTGNYGSYAMYFGRRGGTSLPFNGREYQTVIRSRLLSAAELSSLETYVAAKTGVIL